MKNQEEMAQEPDNMLVAKFKMRPFLWTKVTRNQDATGPTPGNTQRARCKEMIFLSIKVTRKAEEMVLILDSTTVHKERSSTK